MLNRYVKLKNDHIKQNKKLNRVQSYPSTNYGRKLISFGTNTKVNVFEHERARCGVGQLIEKLCVRRRREVARAAHCRRTRRVSVSGTRTSSGACVRPLPAAHPPLTLCSQLLLFSSSSSSLLYLRATKEFHLDLTRHKPGVSYWCMQLLSLLVISVELSSLGIAVRQTEGRALAAAAGTIYCIPRQKFTH